YYNLVWETDGNLNVYQISGGSTVWSSNTSGSSPYMLCNQEDGNLVIYNTSWVQIWSTSTGTGSTSCSSTSSTATACSFGGMGGDLVLHGTQLRLVPAAGDASWATPTCSDTGAFTCSSSKEGNVASMTMDSTNHCYSSATTILSNNDAEL